MRWMVMVVLAGCSPIASSSDAGSLVGKACDPTKDRSVCEVDGEITSCNQGLWFRYPCSRCRAGQLLTNCDAGICTCD